MTVLHLALAADWAAAQPRGSYAVSTLGRTVAEVGFLHASEDLAQLRSVAERYYGDVTEPLVVLTIDESQLGVPVVREVPPGETAAYPHVMGEVPVGAVVRVDPWRPGAARLVVRPAVREDVPALAALLVEDPLGASRESPDEPAIYVAALARMGGPDNRLMVAELDGRVVGMLQLTIIPGFSRRGAVRSVVEAVRVAAAWRGQGIGAQLVTWAVEESRRRGCTLVQLTSDASRADAHRFYERLGFVASHVGFKRQL